MKSKWFSLLLTSIAFAAGIQHPQRSLAADATATFSGEKTAWHGFDRFDFLMDEATFALNPIKAAPDKGNGVKGQVPGQLRCVVVVPKEAAPGTPWSWQGCYFDHEPQVEIELLKRGFHIGFILSDAGKPWDAWYTFLTEGHGFHIVIGPALTDVNGPVLQQWNAVYEYLVGHDFSKKPVMEGAGGAAGEAYARAIANADKVSCIYGENPLLRSNLAKEQPLENLAALAKAGVQILHVCGSLDPWFKSQTKVAETRYRELGGQITIIEKEGEGHYPLAPKDRQPVVDFIINRFGARNTP